MPFATRSVALVIASCLLLHLAGCKPGESSDAPSSPDTAHGNADAVLKEMLDYRLATRLAYNSRRFDDLEKNANDVRASKAKFGNGSWKIAQYYDCLGCSETEPESMWQLHGEIHKAWIAAKPDSVTARVAQVGYLLEYAWHARGTNFADKVTPEGWRLFGERLKVAHRALIDSEKLCAKCPGWWSIGLRIGLGEQWPRENYEQFYAHAKALEPTFWGFDTAHSRYLSLKWYGRAGEWEAAAETAAAAPDGLGMEIYTRCVLEQHFNYDNVFKQTRATWSKTQQGCELMMKRYPGSVEVVRAYCLLASLAGDQPMAKRFFDQLGDNAWSEIWGTRDNFQRTKAWAANTR